MPEDDRGESPAIEVFEFEDPQGYFAGEFIISVKIAANLQLCRHSKKRRCFLCYYYKRKQTYISGSPEVRSPRPKEVLYRVGQVVRHKKWGYRGVIVGWDATARVFIWQT